MYKQSSLFPLFAQLGFANSGHLFERETYKAEKQDKKSWKKDEISG